MLTIKHTDGKGTTVLVEAQFFVTERRPDGYTQFLAHNGNRDDYIATWCGDERSAPTCNVIYVMNSRGSTVSTHSFAEPNFSMSADLLADAQSQMIAA